MIQKSLTEEDIKNFIDEHGNSPMKREDEIGVYYSFGSYVEGKPSDLCAFYLVPLAMYDASLSVKKNISVEKTKATGFKKGTPSIMQLMNITKEALEGEYDSPLPEFTVSDLLNSVPLERLRVSRSKEKDLIETGGMVSFLLEKGNKTYALTAQIVKIDGKNLNQIQEKDIEQFINSHATEKLTQKEDYDQGKSLSYSFGEGNQKGMATTDTCARFTLIPMEAYNSIRGGSL